MKTLTDRILVGGIVMAGLALAWAVSGSLEPTVIGVGDTAPHFSVKADSGKTFTPTEFGGKLLVLNFWAGWCQPCWSEAPSLEQFTREFGPQGVVVLGVSMDTKPEVYKNFLDQFGVSFEVAMDPTWDIAASYGTFKLPETYIIDRSGKVVLKVVNAQNWMEPGFVASVKRLL